MDLNLAAVPTITGQFLFAAIDVHRVDEPLSIPDSAVIDVSTQELAPGNPGVRSRNHRHIVDERCKKYVSFVERDIDLGIVLVPLIAIPSQHWIYVHVTSVTTIVLMAGQSFLLASHTLM